MHLLSVNVGRERPIQGGKKSGKSAIFKEPADWPVRVTVRGLAGDEISDTEHHGGADQAVYLYGAPDYAWWSEELGKELGPGTFGENLTVTDLLSDEYLIGDRFLVGSTVLEVTAPRIPCVTLNARMKDSTFVRRFMRAERPGLYCRVLREGQVRAGDTVTSERYEGEEVFAVEVFRDFFDPEPPEDALRRQLAVPIAGRARVHKQGQLERLLARGGSSVAGGAVSES